MKRNILILLFATIGVCGCLVGAGLAGEPLRRCFLDRQPAPGTDQQRPAGPSCAIELTCTDKPVQLGYSDGVCVRATCPGIWALMHKRADQASFRKREFTYRHYAYNGRWQLKDQGVIETGPAGYRELFAVLPEDLIELKLTDPDPNAAIEVTNLGYIKKGSLEEVKQWVAYNTYLERPVFRSPDSDNSGNNTSSASGTMPYVMSLHGLTGALYSELAAIWSAFR